jgi:hypothetical protein
MGRVHLRDAQRTVRSPDGRGDALDEGVGVQTFFKNISGVGGGIEVPFIGIHVATVAGWQLKRRGDEGPDAALFDLHASLSFVNQAIWADKDYEKEVILELGRGRPKYKVEQGPGFKTALNGRMLVMEGVTLCQLP